MTSAASEGKYRAFGVMLSHKPLSPREDSAEEIQLFLSDPDFPFGQIIK